MEQNLQLEKKSIKKQCNHVAWGLILYLLINIGIIMLDGMVKMVQIMLSTPVEAEQNRLMDELYANMLENGQSSIVAVIVGALFLFLFFRKTIGVKDIFQRNRTMSVRHFGYMLCIFMGGQLLFDYCARLMEMGLNLMGYSALESIESATGTSTTLSMFLYASIVAPVVEELVYRGFVLRSLTRFDKKFAIILSATLFGIMHANLPQAVFAFVVGLVLGYVAVEYSILWSIVLHIINNCLFGDVLSFIISDFSPSVQDVIYTGIMGAFFVATVMILWKKRKTVKCYLESNKTSPKLYVYAFTSIAVVIFIVMELYIAISELHPL